MKVASKFKITKIFQTILLILAIGLFLYGAVVSYQAEQQRGYQKASEQFEISITDKSNVRVSSYSMEYKFSFVIKNNSEKIARSVVGTMKIMDAENNVLSTGKAIFSDEFLAGSEMRFTLTWSADISEEAREIWNSDFDLLTISYQITEIMFEDYSSVAVNVEPYIKPCNKDAFNALEEAYHSAIALFEQEKYSEAIALFEELGEYKDSGDYYDQCTTILEQLATEAEYAEALSLLAQEKYGEALNAFTELNGYKDSIEKIAELKETVEAKADDLAETGNYADAASLLAEIGYDQEYGSMYAAYSYASEGNFIKAVKCGLTVVIIPEGIEVIPDDYFEDLDHRYALKKVVLPSTIKSIGNYAFNGCVSLEEVNLPAGMTTIGTGVFQGCTGLTKITLPTGLLAIGNDAFSGSGITEIQFPGSLQMIGNSAFWGCDSLTEVVLPNSLVSLGGYAFSNCALLASVSIPGSIKTISDFAFHGCEKLMRVSIANGVEVIGEEAFGECLMLTTVTLPDSLVEIRKYAFYQCTSLSEITIPASVTSIGSSAFAGCSSLNNVYFECTEGWRSGIRVVDVTDSRDNASTLKTQMYTVWSRSDD